MLGMGRRIYGALVAPRAVQEEERRRALTLNGLLVGFIVLAVVPAVQRAIQISDGGPETGDHVETLVVFSVATAALILLLVFSSRGWLVHAAFGLLGALYFVQLWSVVSEGPLKSMTIVISMLLVVVAGVLFRTRVAVAAAGIAALTLLIVTVLESAGMLQAPRESVPGKPDVVTVLEIGGAFLVGAALLATRTHDRSNSAAELVGSASSPLRELRTSVLTVRELEVAKLVAMGKSDADISRGLFVSTRTVNSHVSSALRKTGCSNRTELAVLAVNEGMAESDARE